CPPGGLIALRTGLDASAAETVDQIQTASSVVEIAKPSRVTVRRAGMDTSAGAGKNYAIGSRNIPAALTMPGRCRPNPCLAATALCYVKPTRQPSATEWVQRIHFGTLAVHARVLPADSQRVRRAVPGKPCHRRRFQSDDCPE